MNIFTLDESFLDLAARFVLSVYSGQRRGGEEGCATGSGASEMWLASTANTEMVQISERIDGHWGNLVAGILYASSWMILPFCNSGALDCTKCHLGAMQNCEFWPLYLLFVQDLDCIHACTGALYTRYRHFMR